MGALYKARHPTLDRVVLLKKLALQGGGTQFVERFRREARLMMDFKHEHIVQVHDHFKEGSHYYIVEEYVDGMSLEAIIRRERYLSSDAAMLIFLEVCKALKYAHDKQVIHRDIKPGNVLLSREGQVKLVDFGIATSREEPDDGLTREGTILGTPAYIAPEQIDDARSVDKRADIYSLGVLLYEMITGRTPYPGSFTAETIRLIHRGRYVSARKLNPTASPLLCKVARTCMKVRPLTALPGPRTDHPAPGAPHPSPRRRFGQKRGPGDRPGEGAARDVPPPRVVGRPVARLPSWWVSSWRGPSGSSGRRVSCTNTCFPPATEPSS